MRARNYQRELDAILHELEGAKTPPRLFLHSCCAPCSSYVLEYLSRYFRITDFYYNPNITEAAEYEKRVAELQRLIASQPHLHPVEFLEGPYEPEKFFETVKGYEDCREGGERCLRCFRLRLREAAARAAMGAADGTPYAFFTTALTISPLKQAAAINEIGQAAGEEFGVRWLPSDFKKRGGYQRSLELSREYDLYRQDYCGCVFSKRRDLQMQRPASPAAAHK